MEQIPQEEKKEDVKEKVQEVKKMLNQKYPYQGFSRPVNHEADFALQENMTTWTQIIALA